MASTLDTARNDYRKRLYRFGPQGSTYDKSVMTASIPNAKLGAGQEMDESLPMFSGGIKINLPAPAATGLPTFDAGLIDYAAEQARKNPDSYFTNNTPQAPTQNAATRWQARASGDDPNAFFYGGRSADDSMSPQRRALGFAAGRINASAPMARLERGLRDTGGLSGPSLTPEADWRNKFKRRAI
jgi:hypothetical protein